ncbi:MAG TPA: GlsB/YeaQ/YmgE family stress response membrane protein [Myxococcales bacterium]|nr:GlsB/YeaQ/YmgE family stress response membrane protein [Myxococcales bacterium]
MSIIGFLIFGLIIGLIARAIYPGRQHMGWIATAVLGMVGSLVGGLIGHALFGNHSAADGGWGLTPGGWISSIIGAIVVLWAYLALAGGRSRTVV